MIMTLRGIYLAFAVCDKVNDHADHVVDGRVRCLIHESSHESHEGQESEADLEGPVDGGASDEAQRPLEGEHGEAKDEIKDLQDGYRLDGPVESLGEEIPEYLGPEEAFNGGDDLVCAPVVLAWCYTQGRSKRAIVALTRCGRKDDEPSPMVLDKPAHFLSRRVM
jgi:hypothetical protein